MKNNELIRVMEKRDIATVEQLMSAIEAGMKTARIKILKNKNYINELEEMIKIKQGENQRFKILIGSGFRAVEILKGLQQISMYDFHF